MPKYFARNVAEVMLQESEREDCRGCEASSQEGRASSENFTAFNGNDDEYDDEVDDDCDDGDGDDNDEEGSPEVCASSENSTFNVDYDDEVMMMMMVMI